MARHIFLVRHGETRSNLAGIWQGWQDAPLSDRGTDQVKRLADRLTARQFDRVVSSDLGRAVETAAALGVTAELDERWREMHLGSWEGLTTHEIEARDAEALAAFRAGGDVAVGGGERLSDLAARVRAALDDLVAQLDEGERALVVAHGGVIMTLLYSVLGLERAGVLATVLNTSLTRLEVDDRDRFTLVSFNDATHLDGQHDGFGPHSQAVLIRHGETEANLEGRWQGRTDGTLSPRGRAQIEHVTQWVPPVVAVYSSPLGRAAETATTIAAPLGLEPRPHPDLMEMDFGAWEGMSAAEIADRFPDEWRRFRYEGRDEPRGGTGETFASTGERIASAVAELAQRHPRAPFAAVTHGGATRAYVAHLLGLGFGERRRLVLPDNTSMSRVIVHADRTSLAEYNLAPHLTG